MTYKRIKLSGSTDGKNVKITATATAGTVIHTAQSGTSFVDILTLYAYNSHATQIRTLTLEWGGVAAPDDHRVFHIEPKKDIVIVPDDVIQNSLVVRGFADVASEVMVHGFCNRES